MRAVGEPAVIVYCHFRDCRRSSGAPVSIFAGYPSQGAWGQFREALPSTRGAALRLA